MAERELSQREQLTLDKIKQETARAVAQTEAALAEAEEFRANAKKSLAEAEQLKYQTLQDKIDAEKAERAEREELAGNKYNKKYNFTHAVDSKSAQELMNQLTIWSRQEPLCSMEIVFSSPGGSVIDGMALFDFIQSLRALGHKVTTGAIGYAASMAGILLQAGDVRWLGRESYILIHEVSFGAGGKIGEVEDEVKFVKKIQERVIKIFAARCAEAGKNGTADKPLSANQLKEKWSRRDWWISSDEAISWGLVDEVR
jgi:ATP-dependent Clp protease protease subunit